MQFRKKMAKYVVAGKSDCPFYARAEMLADELATRVPDFSVHKIVLASEDWDDWISKTCKEKDWNYNGGSPVIWRELINRGGKGILLGSCNEFLEMAKGYYGITCSKTTEQLLCIANENNETSKAVLMEQKELLSLKKKFTMAVINADSNVAYAVLPHLCSTQLLHVNDHEIHVNLYSDNCERFDTLNGIKMELEDCSLPDVTKVEIESNLGTALEKSNLILYISENAVLDIATATKIKKFGIKMNNLADTNCKIVIVGPQSMKICYLLSQFCSAIPRENFFALSRIEENKVKALLANKLNVITAGIADVLIWGSYTDFIIDLSNSKVKGYDGAIWAPHLNNFCHNVIEMIYEKTWLEEDLPKVLDKNTEEKNKDMSMSAAIISQISDIMNPTTVGLSSLGLVSKGWYNVPEGLVFSFPVSYANGGVIVKEDLNLTEQLKEKLKNTCSKLQDECEKLLEELK